MKCIPNGSQSELSSTVDSNIILENIEEKERIQRVTQETFGAYPQPQLEFAQYKVGWHSEQHLQVGAFCCCC